MGIEQGRSHDTEIPGVTKPLIIAHAANTEDEVFKALSCRVDGVEIDVAWSFWNKDPRTRHFGLPVPYPPHARVEDLINVIKRQNRPMTVCLDLKYPFPRRPYDIGAFLDKVRDSESLNFVLTGGNRYILNTLSEQGIEIWYPVRNRKDASKILSDPQVRTVSVRADVYRELGKDGFFDRKVYVWGIARDEQIEIAQLRPEGLIIDL